MGQWLATEVEQTSHRTVGSNAFARASLSGIAALATGAAVLVAAMLTLVFAATLAVAAILAGVLFALYALAHRSRRGTRRPIVIDARRVGHSWVAYGWNKRAPR